ncbi:hypothetical protein QTV44_002508 [Vibrio vulnificus]|nr:hypothetical protein [Vibrio vulnificus]
MRYLLVTGHSIPKFYRPDGNTVEVELNYVSSKTISSFNEAGEITSEQVGGSPPCAGNIWLVDSIEEALQRLAEKGVYPFINKQAARTTAQRLGLLSYKYIPVH